jgi:hypothetical protein
MNQFFTKTRINLQAIAQISIQLYSKKLAIAHLTYQITLTHCAMSLIKITKLEFFSQ